MLAVAVAVILMVILQALRLVVGLLELPQM
jgi:hypothetical protein